MIYGVTIGSKGPKLHSRALEDMKNLGLTALRFQAPMSLLKQSLDIYDDAVQRCNEAGIDICLSIKRAPDSGFPTPQEMADFAEVLVSRYDGKHGHGKIQILDCGNEDYNRGRTFHFAELASAMVATYERVKAINPDLIVLPGATLQRNEKNIRAALDTLWKQASGSFDAINVHPYFGIPDNGSTDPRDGSLPNIPSFTQYVQAVKEVNAAHGKSDFPIWITEFGFPITLEFGRPSHQKVTLEEQWTYLKHCYDEGQRLGVAAMFVFTLGYANPSDGMSFLQAGEPTATYWKVKEYIAAQAGGEEPGEEDPDTGGPTPEQIARALALLNQAEEKLQQARVLLS